MFYLLYTIYYNIGHKIEFNIIINYNIINRNGYRGYCIG